MPDTDSSIRRYIRTLTRRLMEVAVIVLICILMLDGIIAFTFHHPGSVPSALSGFMRLVNISAARPQPSYDPACSRYDFEVNYRFKTGHCRHRSWEFDVQIQGNSLGYPDDEASLESPDIVILGDSYAAGWGVELAQAFPALLESMSGEKVLVAAAPSYATGRELALLDEMDLSRVKTVIIQYSENDAFENLEVFKNEKVIPIHHMVYRSVSRTNLKRKRYLERPYFPGKYLYLVYLAFQQPASPASPDDDSKAEHLLTIIARSTLADLPNTRIIIVSVYENNKDDAAFVSAVKKQLEQKQNDPSEIYRRINVLGTSDVLENDDYFILDDHLRPSGHNKVATLLNQSLAE